MDFGCGPGFFTVPFAKIAKEVVAVDSQPKMLGKLSKYAKKNGVIVKAIQSDGKSIPLPGGSFDLIFLSGVYHELGEKRKNCNQGEGSEWPYSAWTARSRHTGSLRGAEGRRPYCTRTRN